MFPFLIATTNFMKILIIFTNLAYNYMNKRLLK